MVFGLNQPLVLHGFNIEGNLWMKKFVIDYSHGFGLKFRDNLVNTEARGQHLAFNVTHTLGVGFGYRFTEGFNLRVEPKMHIWEMYYDDDLDTKITTYTTYTLGLGAYYRWIPVGGLTIVPSVRWWPNVGSTLKGDEFTYSNVRTGRTETHRANNIGVSNTPWFVNVSVGWTF